VTDQNKVILVNGDASKFFDQAIFIVKKNIPEKNIPVDYVAEAEKIIGTYLSKKHNKHDTYVHFAPEVEMDMMRDEIIRRKNAQKFNIILNLLLAATCLVLLYIVLY
jgi:hypothetical protein